MPEAATLEAPPASNQNASGTTSASLELAQEIVALSKPKPVEATKDPVKETPESEVELDTPDKPKDTAPKTAAKEKPLSEWTLAEFDEAMKKAPSKAYKIYEAYKKKTEPELAEAKTLREKIKTLESRPESPANDKKIEQYEAQLKELSESLKAERQTIAELDYRRSDEYKENYIAKHKQVEDAALQELKRLTITEGEVTRQATDADFDTLMDQKVSGQFETAAKWFGDSPKARRLLTLLNRMDEIKVDAQQAAYKAGKLADSKRAQAEIQTKGEQKTYTDTLNYERQQLIQNLPALFGATENKEASDAFQKGLVFAEKALSERDSMSPQMKAAHDAVIHMTTAGYHRAVAELAQKNSEIASLKAELEKARGSDPGKALNGKSSSGKVADDEAMGIEDTARSIAAVK